MKPKTLKRVYWTLISLFSLLMFADGIPAIMRIEQARLIMQQLSYPIYLLTILGFAKIIGSIAIFQWKYPTLREWAFAGFTINFIGASVSHIFSNDPVINIISPLIFLVIMFAIYYAWKRYEKIKTAS